MAIWQLRPIWDKTIATTEKFAIFRDEMNRVATVDDVQKILGLMETQVPTVAGNLFAREETRSPVNAVAF
jgi:hypothetical protein